VGRPPGTDPSCAGLGLVDAWCDDPVALVRKGRPCAPIHRHSSWWPDPQVASLAGKLVDRLAPEEPLDVATNGHRLEHVGSASAELPNE
jgi:hypothetical protein